MNLILPLQNESKIQLYFFSSKTGEIWPKPFEQKTFDYFSIVRPSLLKFEVKIPIERPINFYPYKHAYFFFVFCLFASDDKQIQNESCDVLTEAITRYKRIIKLLLKRDFSSKKRAHKPQLVELAHPEFRNDAYFSGFLDEIIINLRRPCEETPHPQMKEECRTFHKNILIDFDYFQY